jgi:hypothetical protein
VPGQWKGDQRLARWVGSQREYKKRLDRSELRPQLTAIVSERVATLDALGFEWEPKINHGRGYQTVGWGANLAKLEAYKAAHGDCNVPRRWAEDPTLGRWVGHQRARKKALDRGEPSDGMTAERAAKLEALGFAW